MNKILILLIFLILTISCNNLKNNDNSKVLITKENIKLKEAFKKRVFYECLKISFENKEIFKQIREEDFFDTSNYLTFKALDKAKELALECQKRIPKWQAKCDTCKVKVYKKPIFSYCLEYFKSKELDSITNSVFKK